MPRGTALGCCGSSRWRRQLVSTRGAISELRGAGGKGAARDSRATGHGERLRVLGGHLASPPTVCRPGPRARWFISRLAHKLPDTGAAAPFFGAASTSRGSERQDTRVARRQTRLGSDPKRRPVPGEGARRGCVQAPVCSPRSGDDGAVMSFDWILHLLQATVSAAEQTERQASCCAKRGACRALGGALHTRCGRI